MDREEAERYIERKGKLVEPRSEKEAKEINEERVQRVMKKGKIYGDPLVILNE